MTAPATLPAPTDTSDVPDILHAVCPCQDGKRPELAVCGEDVSDAPDWDGAPIQRCVICEADCRRPCRYCGTRVHLE